MSATSLSVYFMLLFPSAEKPHFLVRFQNTMANVGEPLRLDCRLDGIPEPDIIWYKDDQPLQPGEGVSRVMKRSIKDVIIKMTSLSKLGKGGVGDGREKNHRGHNIYGSSPSHLFIWYKDDQPLQPGEGVSSEGGGSRVLGKEGGERVRRVSLLWMSFEPGEALNFGIGR